MLEQKFVIRNKTGLHARPASLFVRMAGNYKCQISLIKDKQIINAKSIVSLLSLGAGNGDEISIVTDGEDEQAAMRELLNFLEGLTD